MGKCEKLWRRGISVGALVAALAGMVSKVPAANLLPVPALGLSVTRGFSVSVFADADQVPGLSSIAFTPRGELMASGPGYIKILRDLNRDGFAESATFFGDTETGASGMCFDGDALYFIGDGFLARYLDADGDGVADGPAEDLLPLTRGERGGQLIRKGPDGSLYVSVGHDAALLRGQVTMPGAPTETIEAGCILRTSPSGRNATVIADGFHNPVGLDFNELGDLFTADSSEDADLLLPWHVPSNLEHVAMFGHHGWRVAEGGRAWPRPEYYPDTVASIASLNRALPADVVCYRHYQFPAYFRGGFFLCDWAHGQVLFAHSELDGPSYTAAPEIFLSAMGVAGFTPHRLAVGPDGSLFVATGGRHTRPAIYRIQYTAEPLLVAAATNWLLSASTELEAVLTAPQPLDAWSRAYWIPVAHRLGPEVLAKVATDNRELPAHRVRAIEILTEMFGGLIPPVAVRAAQADSPDVRARTAWSLGRAPGDNDFALLVALARDQVPLVRRSAMDALVDLTVALSPALMQAAAAANLAHLDPRLHQAAARLAARLPGEAWTAFWAQSRDGSIQARLGAILALLTRHQEPGVNTTAIEAALEVLTRSRNRDEQRDAVRLMILALGDWRLKDASGEGFAPFETPFALKARQDLASRIAKALLAAFPSAHAELDLEAARLLAMVGCDDNEAQAKIISCFSERSGAAADFHYLTALACLKAPGPEKFTRRVADTLLGMDRKLGGVSVRTDSRWSRRLAELTERLLRRDPALAEAVVRHREFARPAHVALVPLLGPARFLQCARLFQAAVQQNARFPWSEALVDVLSALPPRETTPLFRRQWIDAGLRDRLLLELAHTPEVLDHDKFVEGLSSTRPEVVRASMSALLQLAPDANLKALVPAMRVLRNALFDPPEQTRRAQAVALINHITRRQFNVTETGRDVAAIKASYAPVIQWFAQEHPAWVRQLELDNGADPVVWNVKVQGVEWGRGDPGRGERIFLNAGCVWCHAGPERLGPALGATLGRFSPEDLMLAVALPSRHVAPAYRTMNFRTRDGNLYWGLPVFDANGMVLVQTGANTNLRLAEDFIAARWPSPRSLMPAGLINDLNKPALADLEAFLQALRQAP